MQHKPKKSLGQNFLSNPKILERIVKDAKIEKGDIVLEIGPGTGNLTKFLLENAKKVFAVEKDSSLFDLLSQKFAEEIKAKRLILINEDILELKEGEILPKKYKIVANIPYNITGAILKSFLTSKNQPKQMVLMVQKEVAKRIISFKNKENLLSISVKAYGVPKILFNVGKGNFYPVPKVDSAVISIENISKNLFKNEKIDEKIFWEIVRAGFAHKRKTLSKNLSKIIKNSNINDLDLLKKRAEDLSIKNWVDLGKKYK